MDIQKPDTLFCAAQPLDWRGAPHHAFSVLLGIDMRTGGPLAADTALTTAMRALPPGCRLDAGVPKQEAEWLLAGSVTPRSREGGIADIRVGQGGRRFLVAASPDGAPVPLIWENTALDAENNPLGGKTPLVSDPALPHGAPACPLPLGAWPCRMRHLGTYDARWLRTRWPGLPDDADWRFFNEAQPQQRLPGGLRGDEEIRLAGVFADAPERCFRLPGARLRFELLRQKENAWKEHAIRADTLWLFPGYATALIYWHALVPCADEAASDIAAARFQLSPAHLESVPAPAPSGSPSPEDAPTGAKPTETAAETVPHGMSAAAAAAVAAGMGTAAAATAASTTASASGAASHAASAVPSGASGVSGASAPATGGLSSAPPFSPTGVSATLRQELEESLPDINAALENAGLPPLSPEQIRETHRRIDAISATLADAQAAPPPPPLEEQLRQAGVPEDRIAAATAALELEPPDPTRHTSAAAWREASEAFLARFAALLHPSEQLLESMSQTLRLLGPERGTHLRALSGDMAGTPLDLLQKAGMRPDKAARLLDMLEQTPDDPDQLDAYARTLEAAAGFPAGSVSDRLRQYQETLRRFTESTSATGPLPETGAPGEETPSSAEAAGQRPSETPPPQAAAQHGAPDAGPDARPDAAATPPPASGVPPSRADVAALLASGASLAGVCFAGTDLSGLRFDGRNLSGADLSGARLRGASFADADLSGATLRESDATDAVFLRARLDGARMRGLRAADTDFTGASLAGADAREADFSGALFQECRATEFHAANAVFDNARLRNADFSGADLSGARLCSADLHALRLDGAHLSGAHLSNAALGNGTQAPRADFSGANLAGSAWSGVAAPQAVFRRATAENASFTDCDLTGTAWDAARARHAALTRCSLRGASLQRADLFEASLREARLQAADLRNASLYGADLYRIGTDATTRLEGAHIARTILAARGGKIA